MGWRDRSVVMKAGCSSSGWLHSQYPHGGLQAPITPVPHEVTPSSGLRLPSTPAMYRHPGRQGIHSHIIKIKLKKVSENASFISWASVSFYLLDTQQVQTFFLPSSSSTSRSVPICTCPCDFWTCSTNWHQILLLTVYFGIGKQRPKDHLFV